MRSVSVAIMWTFSWLGFEDLLLNPMFFLCPQVKENNYRGHGDSVDQLCWHPTNPDLFVTASGDKTIRIWDVRTNKCIATVNTKGETSFQISSLYVKIENHV